jgi:hypothetical protein
VSLDFTPTAGVAVVAQFDKIDPAVVFAWPDAFSDLILLRIDLHESAWADERIKRVIVGPDIPIDSQ